MIKFMFCTAGGTSADVESTLVLSVSSTCLGNVVVVAFHSDDLISEKKNTDRIKLDRDHGFLNKVRRQTGV